MLLLWLAACGGPVDADDDGVAAARDCDDQDPALGAPALRYLDEDGDGYGRDAVWSEVCPGGGWVDEPGDCDDSDPSESPGASDARCDCSGGDVSARPVYVDADGDGVGAGDPVAEQCGAREGLSAEGGDCDDADPSVAPGLPETWYDGVDSDCEEGDYDADRDGFDASLHGGADCDDQDADIHPDALEFCDEDQRDEDCDGLVNGDDPDARGWSLGYVDTDNDGYGTGSSQLVCAPGAGFADNDLDCAPDDPTTHPDAEEVCGDGVVNDCGTQTLSCGIYGSMIASSDQATLSAAEAFYVAAEPVSLSTSGDPTWLAGGSFSTSTSGVIKGQDRDGQSADWVVLSSDDIRGSVYALDSADLDGDGVDALLLGAISTYRSSDDVSQGRVWFWPGGSVGGLLDDQDSITGRYGDTGFGYRVALLDDGILVSSPWTSQISGVQGEVYLFDFDPGPEATWLEAEGMWTPARELGVQLGDVLVACDIDADGGKEGLSVLSLSGVHLLDPASFGQLSSDSLLVEETSASRAPEDLSCEDVDGDGHVDLGLLSYGGVWVYRGSSEGFSATADVSLLQNGSTAHVVAADLDGLGARDVAITSQDRRVNLFYGPFETGSYLSEDALQLPETPTSIAGNGQDALLVTGTTRGFLLPGGPGY